MSGRNVLLWGATGQAIVLEELLSSLGHHVIALYDKDDRVDSPFSGVPIYHSIEELRDRFGTATASNTYGIAAIGGTGGRDRIEVHAIFASLGIRLFDAAIHPRAFVARNAYLAAGVQILAGAVVAARASLGEGVIINSSASVDHECVLERGVHIGPGATLAGCVSVGEFAFVGTGAAVLPRIRIGNGATVGAGAVVTRDVPPMSVVRGVPARANEAPANGL